MNDHQTEPTQDDVSAAQREVPIEPTGEADVDAVLESLDTVDELPLADQVAVFERANDGLRQALSEAGQARPQVD